MKGQVEVSSEQVYDDDDNEAVDVNHETDTAEESCDRNQSRPGEEDFARDGPLTRPPE